MMIRFQLLVVILSILFYGCKDREDYVQDFQENKDKFEKLLKLLEERYIKKSREKKPIIVVFNCRYEKPILKNYICDDEFYDLMDDLNLSKIDVTNGLCNEFYYDKVHFLLKRSPSSLGVEYVYDYCGEQANYESDTFYQRKISDNWGLIIDSSFP